MALKNILGQKFGRLTSIRLATEVILEKKKRNDRAAYWECLCDCGNKVIVRSNHLMSGVSKSCGCFKRDNLSELFTKDFGVSNINDLIKNYKQAAKRKQLKFSLSLKEFSVLIFQACHYCGTKYSLTSTRKNIKGDRSVNHNGIDRIDNKLGYEINNCVSCCTTCNYAKRTKSYEEFINWINELVNFQNSRRENFVESVK